MNNPLPPDWRVVFPEDIVSGERTIVSGPFGSNIGKRFFVESGIPVIRGNNLSLGKKRFIDEGFVYLTEEKAREFRNCQAVVGDIVFTAAGTLGQVGIIPQNSKYPVYIISNKQLRLRPDATVALPEYLYYWFSSEGIRNHIIGLNTGSSVPLITLGKLRSVPINLPPLPVQRKIAAILSAYDDLIENNLRRIKILEEMAQNLYREWFVKFRFPGHQHTRFVDSPLGKIPEGWEVVPFTEVADVLSGGTPKTSVPEYWDGTIPFFAPKDAPDSFYVTFTEKSITQIGLKNCNSKLYPKDTVFITARGTVGKVVMPSMDMAMNQSCYALRGKEWTSQFYLFLTTKEQVDYLKKNTGGATFDTIVVDTFRRMFVTKPDAKTVDQFTHMIQPKMGLILNLLKKTGILRRTRDLLLPKLISGEVDVSERDITVPEEAI